MSFQVRACLYETTTLNGVAPCHGDARLAILLATAAFMLQRCLLAEPTSSPVGRYELKPPEERAARGGAGKRGQLAGAAEAVDIKRIKVACRDSVAWYGNPLHDSRGGAVTSCIFSALVIGIRFQIGQGVMSKFCVHGQADSPTTSESCNT